MDKKETDDLLFNNPMVKSAFNAMSEEQRNRYKEFGKSLFNTVNFKDNSIINNVPVSGEDIATYAEESLKSGIHPNSLTVLEIASLKDKYGATKWFEIFGYNREEIDPDKLN